MFPSALRCISLVQPAHIPSCCPFQNMAGEGKEERERGSQSTRLMPVDHTSFKREAQQAWPHLVESAQNAWGPGKVEVEETGANSQAFFPPPPSRAAGPWPNHTSIFAFIVHAVAGVPSTVPALWWLSSLHICGYHGPCSPIICPAVA